MRRRRERGFALLIVLWTLPLLTLIGGQIAASGRSETRLAANLHAAARAEAIADGAVREAIFHLVGGQWPADGVARVVRIGGGMAQVRVFDQGGLLDPNVSPPELMRALLRQLGVPDAKAADLAQALLQWRADSGDGPAITARYRAAGLGYTPTFQPFRSIGEMGLVIGMTPDILAALAPHLSVFRQVDPDPRLADPVVNAALRASGTATDPDRFGPAATRPLLVRIEALATDPGGGGFGRRAVVRIAAPERDTPRPWRILAWDSAAD